MVGTDLKKAAEITISRVLPAAGAQARELGSPVASPARLADGRLAEPSGQQLGLERWGR